MSKITYGILPDHSDLMALIAAHGVPAFLEGVADALNSIADGLEGAQGFAVEVEAKVCVSLSKEIREAIEDIDFDDSSEALSACFPR